MDVTDLVLELLESGGLFEVEFAGLEEVFEGILVFFFVFFGFFSAWKLLDEKDIDNLNELVLDKLVVENVQYFCWDHRTRENFCPLAI